MPFGKGHLNESGKTASLQALRKLNPVKGPSANLSGKPVA